MAAHRSLHRRQAAERRQNTSRGVRVRSAGGHVADAESRDCSRCLSARSADDILVTTPASPFRKGSRLRSQWRLQLQ